MLQTPFYDPNISYEKNFKDGPFGAFADNKKFNRKGKPKVNFLGAKVFLPFGIPAGPLVNEKYCRAAFQKGFDINVYKTVRTRAYPCHKNPNILSVKVKGDLSIKKSQGELVADDNYSEPLSITNSFGVPSMDPDWWQEDMSRAVKAAGKGQVLIGSFQGTKVAGESAADFVADYVLGAKLVKETGAKILEANLSCPNEGTADLLCFDTERVREIAGKIKNEIGNTPLLIKLAYFNSDEHLKDFVEKLGPIIDGMATINTIPAKIVDKKGQQALPGEGRSVSGVCGAAVRWAGLEMVERLQKHRRISKTKFSIVGVGGVMQAGDYQKFIKKGADAVMSATGAMWNPHLAQEIWESEE